MKRGKYLIGAVFIAITALCTILSCVPTYEKERNKMANELKAVISPMALQVWAINVLRTKSPNEELIEGDLPREILNTGRGKPYAIVLYDEENMRTCIMISWGSGFGHQGLLIGDKDFKKMSNNSLSLIEWAPGVYVFAQRH